MSNDWQVGPSHFHDQENSTKEQRTKVQQTQQLKKSMPVLPFFIYCYTVILCLFVDLPARFHYSKLSFTGRTKKVSFKGKNKSSFSLSFTPTHTHASFGELVFLLSANRLIWEHRAAGWAPPWEWRVLGSRLSSEMCFDKEKKMK